MANCSIVDFLDVSHPEVRISQEMMAYIEEIVRQSVDEVSWVMEVVEKDNFVYEVEGVYIPTQKVHATTTEFTGEDIMKLCEEEPEFSPEKWRGWGHSHVNMSVSPSGQDESQMLDFAKACDDFFVGMIHNKQGQFFCWLVDHKRKILFKDVYVNVISQYKEEIKKLLKDRVSKLQYQQKAGFHKNNHQNWGNGYGGYNGNSYNPSGNLPPTTSLLDTTEQKFQTKIGNTIVKHVRKATKDSVTSVNGYEIEGVFYPQSTYLNPYLALKAHNSENSVDFDVMPEIEDWHEDVPKFTL